MAKKSSTYKRTKKAPKWQLPLLLILVLVAVGFGVFIVFFSKAGSTSPQIYLTTDNNSRNATIPNSGGFTYGTTGDKIIACDWDGANGATVAAYRPSNSSFYISNTNASGNASITPFQFGDANGSYIPICGKWRNNTGPATVGLYDTKTATFHLSSSNAQGGKDDSFVFGIPGDIPLACDWEGNGTTDIGVYRPSDGTFYLGIWYGTQWVTLKSVRFGNAGGGDIPVCGNWDKTSFVSGQYNYDTIGVYRPSDATFYLRNTNSEGPRDIATPYGDVNKLLPVVGNWTGTTQTFIGAYAPGNNAPSAPTNLRVNSASTSGISLSWNAATDDGGIKGYSIYRNGVWWKNTDTTATTYTDSRDLAAGKSYSYYVVAYDNSGTTGPQSNTVTANIAAAAVVPTTPPPPTTTTTTPRLGGTIVGESINIGTTLATMCANYNAIRNGAIATYNKNITLYDAVWPGPKGYWRDQTILPSRSQYSLELAKMEALATSCSATNSTSQEIRDDIRQSISNNFAAYNVIRNNLNIMINKLNGYPPLTQ
jgi:hypothetical protein